MQLALFSEVVDHAAVNDSRDYSCSLLQMGHIAKRAPVNQGCIFRLTCSYPELTEDHVLTSAYVKFFRTITRNAVNKSV